MWDCYTASFKSGATHTRSKSTLWEYSSVCSRLTWLASAANQFAGQVPTSLGLLEHLVSLNLVENQPRSQSESHELSFLTALTRCRSLERQYRNSCQIKGSIPKRIMSLKYLNWLDLGDYNLNGAIPSTITRMKNLRRLYLAGSCHATNDFSEANILGVGSFGSVFKGILSEGTLVAVKVLNLQLEGAFKSFDAECKVLARVRHRNLVKVISSCSNPELRALVLQYMPNGSLEKWLYSFNYCFSLFQRVSIMEDVALALEYLHHGQAEPVVQCDLKPSNVLLDDEMVAHVGDFGIAKILTQKKTETQTKTLGTLGYIAPGKHLDLGVIFLLRLLSLVL
eukprot:XP_019078498.1 PREDICTED: probable LRR receptor-like serine/threonine-protein kinase At3g47570 [Vitis vinifera]